MQIIVNVFVVFRIKIYLLTYLLISKKAEEEVLHRFLYYVVLYGVLRHFQNVRSNTHGLVNYLCDTILNTVIDIITVVSASYCIIFIVV